MTELRAAFEETAAANGRSRRKGQSVEHLSIGQAVGRCRGRLIADLKFLNEHLPTDARLERKEIQVLVDDLLIAVRDTPKRRRNPWLRTAVRLLRRLTGGPA